MDNSKKQIKNAVFGVAMTLALMGAAGLFVTFFQLCMYRSFDFADAAALEKYKSFQLGIAALCMVCGVLTVGGLVFAIVATVRGNMIKPPVIVYAAIAFSLFVTAVSVLGYTFNWATGDMESVKVPEYISGTRMSMISLATSFVGTIAEIFACFLAMTVCALFTMRATKHDIVKSEAPASAPLAEHAYGQPGDDDSKSDTDGDYKSEDDDAGDKYCIYCGKRIIPGASYCSHCGNRVE